jgi:mannosidase alpha-like ER degradation enhancer 2
VTLIDALDTLVVMGELDDFRHAVRLIRDNYASFRIDANVSVFETTIRLLGGLLAGHLFAVDRSLDIYSSINPSFAVTREDGDEDWYDIIPSYVEQFVNKSSADSASTAREPVIYEYNNELLTLAIDLGERLLPAFGTKTGIPYGTVNLLHGVPRGETEIASTAGAGSLFLEFEVLSRLTGIKKFGDAADRATRGLFERHSPIGLYGKHINTNTGKWFESASGIGSNSDSFYEYLLKGHLLFHRHDYLHMFTDAYMAIKTYVQHGDWFADVDMNTGKNRRNRVESLHGFWPGIESSIGLCESSAQLLNAFYGVWSDLGFFPEEFDQSQWLAGKFGTSNVNGYYPLRPELIESTYIHYRSCANDRTWLNAGELFLQSLEQKTRTDCGYASVGSIQHSTLSDDMPSFFLSETCKYLYLLFDENNFIHAKDRSYVFSTEAHPFDSMQMPAMNSAAPKTEIATFSSTETMTAEKLEATVSERKRSTAGTRGKKAVPRTASQSVPTHILQDKYMGKRCQKRMWWDASVGFDNEYVLPANSKRLVHVPVADSNSFGESAHHNGHRSDHAYIDQHTIAALKDEKYTVHTVAGKSLHKTEELMRAIELSTGQDLHMHNAAIVFREELVGGYEGQHSKRSRMCLKNEQPQTHHGQGQQQEAGDGANVAQNIQTVEIELEGMGDFVVTVLPNAFSIRSKLFGDSLDITNGKLIKTCSVYTIANNDVCIVGEATVHASYGYPTTKLGEIYGGDSPVRSASAIQLFHAVAGHMDQTSTTCDVAIVDQTGDLLPIDSSLLGERSTNESTDDSKIVEVNAAGATDSSTQRFTRTVKQVKPTTIYWKRTCASALFGRQGPFSHVGTLLQTPEDNKLLCSPVSSDSDVDTQMSKTPSGGLEDSRDTSSSEAESYDSGQRFGLPWTASSRRGGGRNAAQRLRENSVFVVDRGSCMFEEKAQAAERLRAGALIVANSEVPSLLCAVG